MTIRAGTTRIGMSGFSYPEWIGEVYPTGTKRVGMLAEYQKIFRAVEINMTFRRTPEEKTIERWRDAVDPEFRFSLKANQLITHWRRLVDVDGDVAEFMTLARRMGEKLGPVLFQVSPKMQFDPKVLEDFCASLPPGGHYAFEPRHESFAGKEIDEVFARHNVARCLNDELFDPSTYRVTGPLAYFRFHRVDYTPDDLVARAELARRISDEGVDVYAIFAHEDNPDSVRPALKMKELLA
ncbi:MAG: DUF72 domain-containing protein [Actinomycetota bacterium]